MSFSYSADIKNARLQAVSDGVGPGAMIEIGEREGVDVVLAVVKLQSPPFHTPDDGHMQIAGLPLFGTTYAPGKAIAARVVNAAGQVKLYDLTVGPPGSGAHLEITEPDLKPGVLVVIRNGAIVHG